MKKFIETLKNCWRIEDLRQRLLITLLFTAIYRFGSFVVRHGVYISVYCNLTSVSVHRDQKVSTGQALGAVGGEGILQFQLHKNSTRLNPEPWLRR